MLDQWTDQLSAYLDGDMDLATRIRVEAHLAECAECREALVDLRRVVSAAQGYQGVQPIRDGWSSIRAAIEADRTVALPTLSRSLEWRHLIAAGLVMAAVGLGAGRYWFGRDLGGRPSATASSPAVGALVVGLSSAAYDTAVAELQRTLKADRGRLDSATVRSVERSLAIIDRAIEEARAAIQRDTANAYLNSQIASNLRRKLGLLRLATRTIASET
jgi:anti-sigma factor RsiW